MASRTLEWIIRLVDKVSGPSKAVGDSLNSVVKQVDHVKKVAGSAGGGLAGEIGKGIVEAEALKRAFEAVGDTVLRVVESVADLTYEISRFGIEAASFKEQSLIALSTVLGSDSRARSVFGGGLRLAGALPIDARESLNSMKNFAVAGINDPGTLQRLMVMTSDVKAFRGEEGASGFIRQMIDMATVGMQERHLMFLSQQTGIREDLILKHIRELGGFGGTDKQIKELITQGRISKNVGFNAVAMALADQERGPIGTLSKKLSESFEGLVTRLHTRLFLLFSDFDHAPGFRDIKRVLKSAVDLLDTDTALGSDIKSSLGDAISNILSSVFGDVSITDFMRGLPAKIRQVGNIIRGAIEAVKGLAEGLIAGLGPGVSEMLKQIGSGNYDEVRSAFKKLGEFIADLIGLFRSFAPKLDEVKAFADTLTGRKSLGAYISQQGTYGELMKDGLIGYAPADKWLSELFGGGRKHESNDDPELNAAIATVLRGDSGGRPALHFEQHNHFHGDSRDPDRAARRVGDVSRKVVQSYLNSLALARTGAH